MMSGRMFPVEAIHAVSPEQDYVEAAAQTAINLHNDSAEGDLLMFLPGEQEEIENCCRAIEEGIAQHPECPQ